MRRWSYPAAPTGSDIDVAAGVSFPDPYRWLEQDDAAVSQWQAAQNRLAQRYVRSWQHFAVLKDSVEHHLVNRIEALPRFVAGQWFRAQQPTSSSPAGVAISSTPYGEGKHIAIPVGSHGAGVAFVSWIAPSPDGRIVAVGICSDGSEHNRIHLLDVISGEALATAPPQLLMDAWMGGISWLPDGSGFHFLALEGEAQTFKQIVLFHDLASGRQYPANIPLPSANPSDYTLITVSPDGRHLVATHGLFSPRPVAVKALAAPGSRWQPFVTEACGTVAGFVRDDCFIAVTDVGAARGRIVSIPLNAADPNDSSQWQEVVPESDSVLRSVQLIGGRLYVTGFIDTYSCVRVFEPSGAPLGEVPLPARGALAEPFFPIINLLPAAHPDEYHFVFSSFTESWGVYRHPVGADAVETVRAPQIRIENAIVEDHWAVSADGTRVPYHTVHLASAAGSMPAPALVYAYGAFNLPLLPEYPGAMAAFIAAGGIYVHGHIRGGAELGLDWWRGGRMQNKQNCYRDLYAIAEDLLRRGVTARDKLAVIGRSNGGLMAGVVATQRPDLWRAVVAQVPVMDLIGALRDAYGRYALGSEFGDPERAEEVRRIAGFSPYHLVRSETQYPAVFIDAGATDPRCPPWHARKFAARLQASDSAEHPILLRVRDNVGHGLATPRAMHVEGSTEWLAFLMRELGLLPFAP